MIFILFDHNYGCSNIWTTNSTFQHWTNARQFYVLHDIVRANRLQQTHSDFISFICVSPLPSFYQSTHHVRKSRLIYSNMKIRQKLNVSYFNRYPHNKDDEEVLAGELKINEKVFSHPTLFVSPQKFCSFNCFFSIFILIFFFFYLFVVFIHKTHKTFDFVFSTNSF